MLEGVCICRLLLSGPTSCAGLLEQVEDTQCMCLLHHRVQEDDGASAANPHTAVYQERQVQVSWVLLADTMDEGDYRHGIAGHSMWSGQAM